MNRILITIGGLGLICTFGCRDLAPEGERGPDGTIAYYLSIESSHPGVSIETNHVFAGKTPLTVQIFGDPPGTFHNSGSSEYVLHAIPSTTSEFAQTRVFRTGKPSAPGDKIPGVIFFDMSQQTGGLLIDSFPDK